MLANANKCRQMLTNALPSSAEVITETNTSKHEQMRTNASKCLHPVYCGFLHPPFAIPLVSLFAVRSLKESHWLPMQPYL